MQIHFKFIMTNSILVCLLFTLIGLTASIDNDSVIKLNVYPNYGFVAENIEIRCQISAPSDYDHIYLLVKTDNVRPSGILLMVDNTVNQCRINKAQFITVHICNSTLILIHINHVVLNDTLHTIQYECNQGEESALSSYQLLKEQPAQYYDMKSTNSSSSLTHTLLLLLLLSILLITRLTTTYEFR
ncbi:unnamed protein product [Adineta steineri]|uniref:Uncharacterized protein n=1 Tax=Adineta steineri TaxID=433720 RepID=A0A815Q2L3_9BILA|nr:unnamed protein product [Adineta steineri]CAF3973335.1 unnamed protein product [Adineta steineri]